MLQRRQHLGGRQAPDLHDFPVPVFRDHLRVEHAFAGQHILRLIAFRNPAAHARDQVQRIARRDVLRIEPGFLVAFAHKRELFGLARADQPADQRIPHPRIRRF